jgi:hypothetical protein
MQNPPLGRVGWIGSDVWCGLASVCSPALEGLEHHVAHRADIGFNALQPVCVYFAVLGTLGVDAGALGDEFAVQPL